MPLLGSDVVPGPDQVRLASPRVLSRTFGTGVEAEHQHEPVKSSHRTLRVEAEVDGLRIPRPYRGSLSRQPFCARVRGGEYQAAGVRPQELRAIRSKMTDGELALIGNRMSLALPFFRAWPRMPPPCRMTDGKARGRRSGRGMAIAWRRAPMARWFVDRLPQQGIPSVSLRRLLAGSPVRGVPRLGGSGCTADSRGSIPARSSSRFGVAARRARVRRPGAGARGGGGGRRAALPRGGAVPGASSPMRGWPWRGSAMRWRAIPPSNCSRSA